MADGYQRKYARLRGLRFHYLCWGDPGNLAVVCLHGTGDSCRTWDAFCAAASETFAVVALDQRGHGDSDWAIPPAYRGEDYVSDLFAFLDRLNLEKFILMGHSMGALHCTWYASEKPERVAALIHVDIAPRPPAWNKRYLLGLYENLPDLYDSPEAYVKELRETSAYAREELLLHLASANLERHEDGKYYRKCDRHVFRSFDDYDLNRRLPLVTCPTLVVRGSESRVLEAETALEMLRNLPRGTLVEIPAAGHPVHVDNPDRFNEAVMGFLRDL